MQNSDLWTRITSLYGSQTSPAILCVQIAWLAPEILVSKGSGTHLWFCACKTATLGPDLQVCMGRRPHLWFRTHITVCLAQVSSLYVFQPSPVVLFMQYSDFRTGFKSLCGPQTILEVFACKTATLGPDLQVCMGPRPNVWYWAHILVPIGPSPHLWFLYAKQRLVEQHKRVYRYQTSPVVSCTQTRVNSTRITSFYGFQPSSVVFVCKTATCGIA